MALIDLNRDRERLKILWHLAWPAIIEQILGTMVSYVDTAMVGSLGANGTAAVSVNGPALWLIGGALMGLGVGYSVQVSNAVGAGDSDRARTIIQQGFLAALISGVLTCAIYEVLGGQISVWMGAKPEIRQSATNYLRIYAAAYPCMAFQGIFSSVLRSTGNSKTPLIINTQTNLMNMVLNFFLIYGTRTVTILGTSFTMWGAGMGVEGAALASAVAMSIGGLRTAWACFHQKGYETTLTRQALRPNRPIIRRALHLGTPAAVERVIINAGQIAMTALVAHALNTVALAANQIGNVAEGFCYLPAMGIGFATVALVGQGVGAGNREDVEAYGHLGGIIGVGMTVVTSIIMFIFAPNVMRIFNSDAAVVYEAARALRIQLFAEPLFAASNVYFAALRGVDDTKFPMYAGLVCMWLIRVPVAFVCTLKLGMGLPGVWLAMACDLGSRGILAMWRWYRRGWLKGLPQLNRDKAESKA